MHFQESGQPIRCQHCSQTFHDMKSLQIHNFLEHHVPESATPPLLHPGPEYPPAPGLSCHICGMNLPNQTTFQQVNYFFKKSLNCNLNKSSLLAALANTRGVPSVHLQPLRRGVHQHEPAGEPQQATLVRLLQPLITIVITTNKYRLYIICSLSLG